MRVADGAGTSSSRGGCGLLICVLIGLVAYFYFDVRLWTAIAAGLLAPVLLPLGGVALLLLFGAMSAPFYHLTRVRRNRDLRRLLTEVLRGAKKKRIILFLRQFEPRRGWRIRIGLTRNTGDIFDDDDPDRYFLESWADDLSTDGVHVVKVADRVDATLAGSIRLDDDTWRTDVLRLMAVAEAILLLPGKGEGLSWEVAQIKEQGRVSMTTIVMPFGSRPARSDPFWESCRAQYRTLGFELPPFSPDGMLMKFSASGALVGAMPLLGSSAETLREFIFANA